MSRKSYLRETSYLKEVIENAIIELEYLGRTLDSPDKELVRKNFNYVMRTLKEGLQNI